jgi:ribosomal protein S18 acetylase RimI-like enzyme
MSEVLLRSAGVTDAPAIAAVHRLSRAAYYGIDPDPGDRREEMWTALLEQPRRQTYVVEDAAVRGFISISRSDGDRRGLELTALYVHPHFFGRGLGSVLYERFVVARRPRENAVLEVWAGNERALSFYESRGWHATAISRPGPQDQPFLTYRLV